MRRARAGDRARAASEQISTPSSPVVARARMCGERHARRVHFTRSTSRRLVGKVVSSKESGFRKNRTDSGSRVHGATNPLASKSCSSLRSCSASCVLARPSSLRVSRAWTQKTRRVCRINRDVSEVSIAAFRRLRRYRYRSRKRRNRDDPTRVHRRRPRWQPSSARSLWQLTTSSLALSLSIELPAPPKCGRSLPVSTRWSIVAALNIPPIGAARRR